MKDEYRSHFIALIKSRRSIRKWQDKEIDPSLIKQIISCGLNAPSAYDAHPWELIVIDNSTLVADLLSDRMQLKESPFYINSSLYINKLGKEKYQKVTSPPLLIVIAGKKEKCHGDLPGLITSLGCCGENMLLAAHALGLGACWLYVHDLDMPETEKRVKKILHIPENLLVLSMLAIGYPKGKLQKRKIGTRYFIHTNTW